MAENKESCEEWSFFTSGGNTLIYNDKCNQCRNTCKQSFRAKIVKCPEFRERRSYGETKIDRC